MKIPAWLTAQVLSLAAIGVLSWALIGQCNAVRSARAEAARASEAQTLAEAGLQQAVQMSEREIVALKNLSQRQIAEALKRQGIDSKPVFVANGTTGPVQVGGDQQPSGPGAAPASGAGGTSSPSAPGPALCLLSTSDQAEIRTLVAGVKTEAGNVVVSGRTSLWRVSPNPGQISLSAPGDKVKDGSVPLRLDVAVSPQVPEPRASGWGAGMATVLTRQGLTLGPAVAAPILHLPFRLQAEASAAVTLNPNSNEWAGTAQVVVRGR